MEEEKTYPSPSLPLPRPEDTEEAWLDPPAQYLYVTPLFLRYASVQYMYIVQYSGKSDWCTHCKEIWIHIFQEKELLGLSPNFHIMCL